MSFPQRHKKVTVTVVEETCHTVEIQLEQHSEEADDELLERAEKIAQRRPRKLWDFSGTRCYAANVEKGWKEDDTE